MGVSTFALLRRIAWAIGATLFCARFVVPTCWAEQLVYEPFELGNGPGEYQVGPIGGQPAIPAGGFFAGPWIAPAGKGGQVVQPTSIVPETPGGSVTASGEGRAGRYLAEPWTSDTSGVFYLSYAARFGTVLNPATMDISALGFRTTEFWPAGSAVGQDNGRMEIGYHAFVGPQTQRWPSSARLQFQMPQITPQYLAETTFNEDNNSPHLIVVKFELSAEQQSDSISVFLDPWGMAEPEIPNGLATGIDFTLGAISTVSFFGGDGGLPPTFDELRVGTRFEDVVAPPVSTGPCTHSAAEQACFLEIISHMHLTGPDVGFADLNGDGRVSLVDYRLWKDGRSDNSPGAGTVAAAKVPEPGTWLSVIALATICCVRVGRPLSDSRV